MTRILITGGTGYIGSCFVKHLLALPKEKLSALANTKSSQDADNQDNLNSLTSANLEIYCLSRRPYNTEYLSDIQSQVHWCEYDGSLRSIKQALETSKPDLVYHLATFFTKEHGDTALPLLLKANIELGCNLIEAMSQYEVKHLIYTTTITEFAYDGSYQPATLYAAMKRAFLDIAQFYINAGQLKLGVLALTDTYGPHDKRPKVLNCLKQATLQQRPMNFNSSGEQIFDLVFIDDVLEALYLLGLHILKDTDQALQYYQVYAAQPLTLKDTVKLFAKVNQVNCQVKWQEASNQNNASISSQAVRVYPCVPNWQEKVTLQEGLVRFFNVQPRNSLCVSVGM